MRNITGFGVKLPFRSLSPIPSNKSQVATQKEIARSLGISQPAVGYVLGNHSRNSTISVTPELRDRILKRSKEMNYRANFFAQRMRGVRAKLIGVIHSSSLLQVKIEQHVRLAKEISKRKYKLASADIVALGDVGLETHAVSAAFDLMIDLKVDGVVLVSLPSIVPSDQISRLHEARIPFVTLGNPPYPDAPFVGADAEQGFRLLTRHLLKQGYRNLLLVSQQISHEAANLNKLSILPRLNGFRAEIEAWGGETMLVNELDNSEKMHARKKRKASGQVRGAVLSVAHKTSIADTYAAGFRALNAILDLDLSTDVVMMPNDDWMQGGLLAAQQRHIDVPEHLGMTGFDGSPYGQFGLRPFTTVQQPLDAMAKKTVEILLAMVAGKELKNSTSLLLPCRLLPGATTKFRATADASAATTA